jgi:hypothetical protein
MALLPSWFTLLLLAAEDEDESRSISLHAAAAAPSPSPSATAPGRTATLGGNDEPPVEDDRAARRHEACKTRHGRAQCMLKCAACAASPALPASAAASHPGARLLTAAKAALPPAGDLPSASPWAQPEPLTAAPCAGLVLPGASAPDELPVAACAPGAADGGHASSAMRSCNEAGEGTKEWRHAAQSL